MHYGFEKGRIAVVAEARKYAEAGVDIDAGNAFVEMIKPCVRSTNRPGADTTLGGFGALFDIRDAGFTDPLLVAAADGVGTKLRVAIEYAEHDTIGIDLVAMCVNDLVVQGAEPLFFLDYFATSKLEGINGVELVSGIAEGCRQAGCALVGGETAEMPGMYKMGDYDLAGFAVGAVERNKLITGKTISVGDVILGLASTGLHANGFSLVRHIVSDAGLNYSEVAPFAGDGQSLGSALLAPTRIYVKSCLEAAKTGNIKGLAHITGGGFIDNVPRVLPKNLTAVIDVSTWDRQPVFEWLARSGNVSEREMIRTFNCGIGMVVIVSPDKAYDIQEILSSNGETVYNIGYIAQADSGRQIEIVNLDTLRAA